jgi:hypothetical protein
MVIQHLCQFIIVAVAYDDYCTTITRACMHDQRNKCFPQTNMMLLNFLAQGILVYLLISWTFWFSYLLALNVALIQDMIRDCFSTTSPHWCTFDMLVWWMYCSKLIKDLIFFFLICILKFFCVKVLALYQLTLEYIYATYKTGSGSPTVPPSDFRSSTCGTRLTCQWPKVRCRHAWSVVTSVWGHFFLSYCTITLIEYMWHSTPKQGWPVLTRIRTRCQHWSIDA